MSMIHRRLEAGENIAPLTVAELDIAQAYCRAQVAELTTKNPLFDDAAIKEAILNDTACPELIKRVSLDRPSVFDLLCSKHRFRPDLFALQRKLLLQLEDKTISEQDAFDNIFKTMIPNSSTIIKDLQKAALKHSSNIQ